MDIEKKIKLGKNISFLYRKSQIYINEQLKEYNIVSSEYMYIMALPTDKKVSLTYLSKELAVDPAQTTKIVNKLVIKGFIIKEKDENDKRAFKISLTNSGKAIKPKLHDVVNEWTKIMIKNFSTEDISLLSQSLGDIRKNIENK